MRKLLIIGFAALTIISGSAYVAAQVSSGGGLLGGDVIGTLTNAIVQRLQGRPVSSAAPMTNQALCWSGTQWAPGSCGGGGTGTGGNCILVNTGSCLLVSSGNSLLIK